MNINTSNAITTATIIITKETITTHFSVSSDISASFSGSKTRLKRAVKISFSILYVDFNNFIDVGGIMLREFFLFHSPGSAGSLGRKPDNVFAVTAVYLVDGFHQGDVPGIAVLEYVELLIIFGGEIHD